MRRLLTNFRDELAGAEALPFVLEDVGGGSAFLEVNELATSLDHGDLNRGWTRMDADGVRQERNFS